MPDDSSDSKQSKGGKGRARKLTPEQRSEIARKGAAAKNRWPQASHEGPLQIGDMVLECAVLNDGTRVISQTKFMDALGIYYSGWLANDLRDSPEHAAMPLHLPYRSLKPYIEKHFGSTKPEVIKYRSKSGGTAHGLKADILPKICEVWLDARSAGLLKASRQVEIAQKAEMLIRGFAHIGIIALVDEATGYQLERQKDALQEALKEFLTDRLRGWVRTFPPAYFRELCRLRGVPYRSDMKLPQYFGHFTNDVVYKRLLPGVLQALEERNPAENGRRKSKHFQWLSGDIGHPSLLQHLGLVVGLMKVANTWDDFKANLDKAAPIIDPDQFPLFRKEIEEA